MKLSIKKGSTVKVIAGSDKGKTGTVLDVNAKNPKRIRIKVQGVRVQTKVDKKENQLIKTEGYIDYSNVALVDKAAKKSAAKSKAAKSAKK
jgi:large subunit ribosomal protein L24